MLLLASMVVFAGDSPQISRSQGEPGGVVVLWPRVIPKTDDLAIRGIARQLQAHLKEVAEEALPGRKIDVRPEPERVCPQAGCKALNVGAVLVHHNGKGCLAVGLVSAPGKSAQKLVPWAGAVAFKVPTVPFREPPESQLTIRDFAACNTLIANLDPQDAEMVRTIRTVFTGGK